MEKMLRRIVASIATLMLAVFAVSGSAMAATTATATISNLSAGDSVQLIPVASVTVNSSNNTLSKSWVGSITPASATSVQAYIDANSSTQNAARNEIAAQVAEGKGGSAINATVADGKATATNLAAGLYFVRVSNAQDAGTVYQNTLVAINLKPNSDGSGSWVAENGSVNLKKSSVAIVKTASKAANGTFADIVNNIAGNETIFYKLTITLPAYDQGVTGRTLKVVDTMPAGIEFKQVVSGDVTASANGQVITFDLANKVGTTGTIDIVYSATVKASSSPETGFVNTAVLTYSKDSVTSATNSVSDTSTLKTADLTIKVIYKETVAANPAASDVSGTTVEKPVQGAGFSVSDGTRTYSPSTTDADGLTTSKVLAFGEYTIDMTTVPAGYSAAQSTTVDLDGNKTVTITLTKDGDALSLLPSTGGMGTILFTLAGVAILTLVSFAAIKRLRSQEA